jgi:dCTP deaminase
MKLGGEILSELFKTATWRAYKGEALLKWEEVEPLIGPNSIDVTLSSTFLIPSSTLDAVDPRDAGTLKWETVKATEGTAVNFHPGAFMLGSVNERFVCEAAVDVPPVLSGECHRKALFAPMYEGRSSCGRLGLASHITAGFGDYGFGGAFTLELYNHFPYSLVLYPGMRIGQVAFEEVYRPKRYKGAYSGDNHFDGPVPPKLGPDRF